MSSDLTAAAGEFAARLAELSPDLLAGPGATDGVRIRADALPVSVHGSNLRGILTPAQWDALRIPVCEAAQNRCEVCGALVRTRRPDCHEQWAFALSTPDAGEGVPWPIQRLERLIALCPDCHRVQHVGLAGLRGEMDKVRRHLAKLNTWTSAEVTADLNRAQARYRLLELVPWDLDLRVLQGQIAIRGYTDLMIPAQGREYLGKARRS